MIGRIYILSSMHTPHLYIGSTTQKLEYRLSEHKYHHKLYLIKKFSYISSYEVVKFMDVEITLLEEISCNNKKKLREREQYWINNHEDKNFLINIKKAIQDLDYDQNLYCKNWRTENKDKITQKSVCSICGGKFTYVNKSTHLKTQRHLKALSKAN